jgi:glycosyltransferase involved in cell wall biosynthesis
MRLLYVYFGPLDVNSAIQAHHFGNELTRMGWEVTIAGEGDAARAASVGEAHFECISHDDLDRKLDQMAREPAETIVVGWTPREPVRQMTVEAVRRLDCPYVVHLEDNEELLIESASGRSLAELQRLPLRQQDKLAPPRLIHPTHYREFLDGAAGITVITEALNDFNLAGRPYALARPGIDLERFRPDLEPHPRRQLGLSEEDFVLVYHGTIHYANQHEMLSLYLAVKLLQRRGRRVRLLRIGHTEFGGPDPRSFRAVADGAVELGPIRWRDMPAYLAVADAYVQPGAIDAFNRYRLPSKLPEFLAMGRPVILPHCNIGNDLTHGENALLLEQGNAMEIAVRIEELLADRELATRLGAGARRFAEESLSWRRNAETVADFLRKCSAAGRPMGSSA